MPTEAKSQLLSLFQNAHASAALLDIKRSTFLKLVRSGAIKPPIKIGTRSVWSREEVEEYARGLVADRDSRVAAVKGKKRNADRVAA